MRSTLVASVTLLALAGCGGGDAGRPAGGSTTSPPATTAPPGPPVALSGKVEDRGSKDLGSATALTLDLGDFYFAPTYVKAAPGASLTLQLENSGAAPHTFTVDEPAKVDVTVAAGGRGVAGFTAPRTGAVAFYCKFHQAQGMQGAIYVTAGATAGASGDDGGAYNQ